MINQVEVEKVYKTFGEVKAVDGVSLKVAQGHFFSLLGPSGCGKTTLLRLIAGFEIPNSGDILIDSKSMDRIAPNLRPTNMVFQNYAIFPHLNVEENVAYGLRKKNLPKEKKLKMINDSLELVGLEGLNKRSSNALSGGQKQRVALARALILKPKVLLLDEPLSALDKKLREQMQSELRNLQKAVGITFILVTHDQEEALTMSDKIAVMFDGKVEQIASPKELYERPASRRVASFIGAMNFVNAEILESNGKVKVKSDLLGKFEISKKQVSGNHINKEITLGIRPELISINPEKSNSKSLIKGEIIEISYLGETTYYKIGFSKNNLQLDVAAQNSFGKINYEVGNKVKINFDKENIVGFV
jgi:spermidine/putrescine transport system ATP-binding protein